MSEQVDLDSSNSNKAMDSNTNIADAPNAYCDSKLRDSRTLFKYIRKNSQCSCKIFLKSNWSRFLVFASMVSDISTYPYSEEKMRNDEARSQYLGIISNI